MPTKRPDGVVSGVFRSACASNYTTTAPGHFSQLGQRGGELFRPADRQRRPWHTDHRGLDGETSGKAGGHQSGADHGAVVVVTGPTREVGQRN